MTYEQFLDQKTQLGGQYGFEPVWLPDSLFDFQKALVDWSLRRGRAALFEDCGLGKTVQQLVWAENIVRKTNKRVLILTPLAVAAQTVREGEKFGIECERNRDGKLNGSKIVVTNYEQLHKFSPKDFVGVAADESSILKNFSGETRKTLTRFMLKMPYRSLWTATAAPNDYVELGTSSEALGELGYTDMLSRFFVLSEKVAHRMQRIKDEKGADAFTNYGKTNRFAQLSFRVTQSINQWTLKGHAKDHFWRWICSWARALRKPSDMGFDDAKFILPPLIEQHHSIEPTKPAEGMLFTVTARGLNEEREERRRTLTERCDKVAELVANDKSAVVWCHLNVEGDQLEKTIPDSHQVCGKDSDDEKEEAYDTFQRGDIRVLITKPVIGAWGLNWQHCAHVVTFASHSWEQYYQAVRRCWRFGQKSPVKVDVISTSGELYVRENMQRKARAAVEMFERLVRHMNEGLKIQRQYNQIEMEVPSWLTK